MGSTHSWPRVEREEERMLEVLLVQELVDTLPSSSRLDNNISISFMERDHLIHPGEVDADSALQTFINADFTVDGCLFGLHEEL